jgi:hypothetical protein
MKLSALLNRISEMSEDELRQHVQDVRHRREIIRPAKQKHIEREERSDSRRVVSKLEKLAGEMSEEERAKLIAQLQLEE